MVSKETELGSDPQPEVNYLLDARPEASAMYAHNELEAGRLEWLAEHIRRSGYQIHPRVARKLLELLDGSHPQFRLKMGARKRRSSKFVPRLDLEIRGQKLAIEVALEGGYNKRTYERDACHKVGERQRPQLAWRTVQRAARPYRDLAMSTLGLGDLPELNSWEIDVTDDTP